MAVIEGHKVAVEEDQVAGRRVVIGRADIKVEGRRAGKGKISNYGVIRSPAKRNIGT